MKVFGVGLQKTGTKTLGACLSQLGYRHVSWSNQAIETYFHGDHQDLIDEMADYDSCEDYPWLLLYKEFDQIYPDAKFILTVRANEDIWFDSISRFSEQIGPVSTRELMFGHAMPRGHRKAFVEKYLARNQEIRDHFKDRPGKLLEICWENTESWDELCTFLGKQAPRVPLPHENRTVNWPMRKLHVIKHYVNRRHPSLVTLYRRLKARRE